MEICRKLADPHEIEQNEFARVERKGGEIAESGMQLREIMTRDVEVIRPETSVSEAAQRCVHSTWTRCQSARPTSRGDGDRSLYYHPPPLGHDPNTAPVRYYMSPTSFVASRTRTSKRLNSSCGNTRSPIASPHARETCRRDCSFGRSGKQSRRTRVICSVFAICWIPKKPQLLQGTLSLSRVPRD